MIKITAIKAFNDNYIWAIINENNRQLIVIDPGQATPVIEFVEANQLRLTAIWITHKHADHTGGVVALQQQYPLVQVVAHKQHGIEPDFFVREGSYLQAWEYNVAVWQIAGHTKHHLAYLLDLQKYDGKQHVFCGDTLFSGGCGRVFTGDYQAMFASLQRLNTLAEDTLLYPAHEYTASNLKFGLYIEPTNGAMKKWQQRVEALTATGEPSLPTSLAVERLINVFLRTNQPAVIESVRDKVELSDETPLAIFTGLRQLKDGF